MQRFIRCSLILPKFSIELDYCSFFCRLIYDVCNGLANSVKFEVVSDLLILSIDADLNSSIVSLSNLPLNSFPLPLTLLYVDITLRRASNRFFEYKNFGDSGKKNKNKTDTMLSPNPKSWIGTHSLLMCLKYTAEKSYAEVLQICKKVPIKVYWPWGMSSRI